MVKIRRHTYYAFQLYIIYICYRLILWLCFILARLVRYFDMQNISTASQEVSREIDTLLEYTELHYAA